MLSPRSRACRGFRPRLPLAAHRQRRHCPPGSRPVFHRKLREQAISAAIHRELHRQFAEDISAGTWHLLPATDALLVKAQAAYATLPPSIFLRAADCLYLVTAREAGFAEIYSNDRHLLAAASHFALKGIGLTSRP